MFGIFHSNKLREKASDSWASRVSFAGSIGVSDPVRNRRTIQIERDVTGEEPTEKYSLVEGCSVSTSTSELQLDAGTTHPVSADPTS